MNIKFLVVITSPPTIYQILVLIPMMIGVCNPLWCPWIFWKPFPWLVLQINCQHHFCWKIIGFTDPLYNLSLTKDARYLYVSSFQNKKSSHSYSSLLKFGCLVILYYSLFYIPSNAKMVINCRVDIHSHQIAPPLCIFFNLYTDISSCNTPFTMEMVPQLWLLMLLWTA